MDIALYDETGRIEKPHLDLMEKLIISAAEKLELGDNFEVSATVVDNEKIHEINREYRSIDRPTDVISFAIEDNDDEDFDVIFEQSFSDLDDSDEFIIPRLLGDIFISIDKVIEQAEEFGHSFEREMGFLVVHGFLHLNGYDHQTPEEEKEMFDLQEVILKENGLER